MSKLTDVKYNMLVNKNNLLQKLGKNKVFTGITDSLFPKNYTCDYCQSEVKESLRSGLCKQCDDKILYNNEQVCMCCGRHIDSETNYCLGCQNYKRYFIMARSPLRYEGIAKELIHKFKFGGKRYLATHFVNLMVDCYLDNNYSCDAICYVPLHRTRYVERGYNQSELLAVELSKRLKLPVLDALTKVKQTNDQIGLTKAERIKNLDKAFTCDKSVKGKSILLVDDVLTTGSTTSECAKVLIKAGAKDVFVLTIASVDEKPYNA